MLSALPLRHETLSLRSWPKQWVIELAPSRAAAAAGYAQTIYTIPDLETPEERFAWPSELYDATKEEAPQIEVFEQRDYLRMISKTVRLIIQLDGVVQKTWLDAINAARVELMRERALLAKDYPGRAHTARWVSKWHFELPEYDPTVSAWNGKGWRPIDIKFMG